MFFCFFCFFRTGWTVFKVGPVVVFTSLDSTLASPLSPQTPHHLATHPSGLALLKTEPLVPMVKQLSRGPRASQGWALRSFIFNCMQKYIYIKNVERRLFNSGTVYLLLNRCLGGQLTRNDLSIRFRMLRAPWSSTSSRHFKRVCYSLWFSSSVTSHQAAPNYSIKKKCHITRIKHEQG